MFLAFINYVDTLHSKYESHNSQEQFLVISSFGIRKRYYFPRFSSFRCLCIILKLFECQQLALIKGVIQHNFCIYFNAIKVCKTILPFSNRSNTNINNFFQI